MFVRDEGGLFDPLGAKVKALGSSIDERSPDPDRAREGGAAGGEDAAAGGEGAAEGGGGGAALGDTCPAARRAACIARGDGPFDAGGGGGGAGEREGGEGTGARGAAAEGGGGGAEGGADGGGAGAAEGGGGGGAPGAGAPGNGVGLFDGAVEGFRDAGRGGGFFPIGGGGPFIDADEPGLGTSLGVLRRLAMAGGSAVAPGGGTGGLPGTAGAAPEGGLGAEKAGTFGAEDDRTLFSGSDRYDESAAAPVSTAPRVLRNFGIPPANSPASCGAASATTGAGARSLPLWSLLLLALFPGTGGARPPGGLGAPPSPGTGGAPPIGGPPPPPDDFPTMGADLSFVTVFLSALPLVISERRAPYRPR